MRGFRTRSVRFQLTLVTAATSAVALVLAGTALLVADVAASRRDAVREVRTLADMVGPGCVSPLLFGDVRAAEQALRVLAAHPDLEGALLFDDRGELFAHYGTTPKSRDAPPAGQDDHRFTDDRVTLWHTIRFDDEVVGRLHLVARTTAMEERLTRYGLTVFNVLIGALVMASVLSARLQDWISRPLVRLSEAAARVRHDGDYTIRVARDRDDEIGRLTETFNDMVAGIEARDAQLSAANRQLSERMIQLEEEMARRQLAQTALAESEAQLRHAQKMEAVGLLAGGIAHDFNNLLTVIQGFAEMTLQGEDLGEDATSSIREVLGAAARAADLTRQLLAFSRRQVLAPHAVDLCELIGARENMLRRLIGEHIDLVTVLDRATPPVFADPGQLEQVLMNLVVNARDAMLPDGGTVTIDVRPLQVGPGESRTLTPGPCASLVVRDNGCGMDDLTQSRIFEPFFTTKKAGTGTGLGLPMIYGIIAQSGGEIRVASVPGHGSTFEILLPLAASDAVNTVAATASDQTAHGWETVLLVEDEDHLRSLAHRALEQYGYSVIDAPHGAAALEAFAAHGGPIDILVTDMVMPRMGGKDLHDALRARQPSLPVLFMSGYTTDGIVVDGVLAPGTPFLQKPFRPQELARRVREVLDARAASVGTHF